MVGIPADFDDAIQAYLAGESQTEVGRKLGVSSSTIGRWLKITGVPRRPNTETNRMRREREDAAAVIEMAEAIRRYREGEAAIHLAQEFGIGYKRFMNLLIREGIQPRTTRENLSIMYARMTPEQRRSIVAKANAAKRGRPASLLTLERAALTRERTMVSAGRYDLLLALWLTQRGVELTPQMALGRYNVDIAVHEPRVIVEVLGEAHTARPAKRREYILNEGWRLIEVVVKGPIAALTELAANRIVALLKEASTNESSWGQHCVIGGYGETLPRFAGDFDNWASIKGSESS